MLCDWDMNLFPPKLNIKFLPIFFTTGISVHLADLLWPFCSYQGHGTVLGVWQISCCWGLGWSNISKINKGLVNQKVLDDWQVGEAEDVEVAFVLLRCWRWGERDPITAKATAARSKTCRNSNFCKTIARNLGKKNKEFGGRDWNVSERPQRGPPPPFLSPSSLHLLLSFQQTGRQPEQSHSNPTPHCCHAEREAGKSSPTAAGFEGHLKNTTRQKQRQAPFSDHAREPEPSLANSPSPSLSLSLSLPLTLSQSPHPPSPSSTQQLNQ